jgi:lipopolysaccharide transport system ATP-binding protein
MPETLIRLENAGVYYRGGWSLGAHPEREPWALRGLNLEVKRGEKLGIVGRNGCGKSTLLRLLASIISPDEGSVSYSRPDLHVQLLALGVGFEGTLSGAENAILSGLFMGKSRRYMESRLDEMQAFSELGDAFYRPVNTYSSGMNSRLGFSIALQTDPEVFLIDEVLSVGDHAFSKKSQAAIREKFKADTTVILISHEANTIQDVCSRAVWLNRGQILAEGAPETVCRTYDENTRAAT